MLDGGSKNRGKEDIFLEEGRQADRYEMLKNAVSEANRNNVHALLELPDELDIKSIQVANHRAMLLRLLENIKDSNEYALQLYYMLRDFNEGAERIRTILAAA